MWPRCENSAGPASATRWPKTPGDPRRGLLHEPTHRIKSIPAAGPAPPSADAGSPRADVPDALVPVSAPLLDPLAPTIRRGVSEFAGDCDSGRGSRRPSSGRPDALAG